MPEFDRNNIEDTQRLVEAFIPDRAARETAIRFMSDGIIYANGIQPGNWNLNLDKNGKFLRFNTGQEYCIQISPNEMLVLYIKQVIENNRNDKKPDIIHRRHKHPPENSDHLVKVPGSAIHRIEFGKIMEDLPVLREANKTFIDYAIRNTKIMENSEKAHSTGSIEYLSYITGVEIPDPSYVEVMEFQNAQNKLIRKAQKKTDEALSRDAANAPKNPEKVSVATYRYKYDPNVTAKAKRDAKGICQGCLKDAPFKDKNGEPYLETHHKIPLSKGGEDSIDNVIALCPNCHREKHYG